MARQGYVLITTARGREPLERAAQTLEGHGGEVVAIAGDVADDEHRRRLVTAAESWGRLDLLVNNASTLGAAPLPGLADYPLDDLEHVFAVNVLAPLALTQLALPLLTAHGGLIVNLSSDAAVGGYPGWGGYGASKAALDLITLTLADELRGVGVVAVDPGDMRTEMHQLAFPGEDISDRPLPDVTLPFWAWLLGQDPMAVSGQRFRAQGDTWEVAA